MTGSGKRPWKPSPPKQAPDWSEYRQWLVAAEHKSQEAFDKTVLSLSGGALGISFVFLKDVIGTAPIRHPGLLLGAWLSWALSAIAILISFFLSHLALRHAINQVDSGTISNQKPGGTYSLATACCNVSGAVLFFVGVCLIMAFANENFTQRGQANGEQATVQTDSTTTETAVPSNAPSEEQ